MRHAVANPFHADGQFDYHKGKCIGLTEFEIRE